MLLLLLLLLMLLLLQAQWAAVRSMLGHQCLLQLQR